MPSTLSTSPIANSRFVIACHYAYGEARQNDFAGTDSDEGWRDVTISADFFTLSRGGKCLGDFMIANYVKAGLICLFAIGMSNNSVAQTSGTPIKNIVLVHGAWADGSGWKGVYNILVS